MVTLATWTIALNDCNETLILCDIFWALAMRFRPIWFIGDLGWNVALKSSITSFIERIVSFMELTV